MPAGIIAGGAPPESPAARTKDADGADAVAVNARFVFSGCTLQIDGFSALRRPCLYT